MAKSAKLLRLSLLLGQKRGEAVVPTCCRRNLALLGFPWCYWTRDKVLPGSHGPTVEGMRCCRGPLMLEKMRNSDYYLCVIGIEF